MNILIIIEGYFLSYLLFSVSSKFNSESGGSRSEVKLFSFTINVKMPCVLAF